jgi:hypothetical protein
MIIECGIFGKFCSQEGNTMASPMKTLSINNGIKAKIQQCRELENLRRELERDISRLVDVLATSSAHKDEDLVFVPEVSDPTDTPQDSWVAQQQREERIWFRVRQMASEISFRAHRAVCERMHKEGALRRIDVKSRLAHLKKRLVAISSALDSLEEILDQSLAKSVQSISA